ncbi:FkbM family methyltransferase [Chelatococcus reniformis]|nr:FkbM family methyltransferase [Chelatococcus reniformis]
MSGPFAMPHDKVKPGRTLRLAGHAIVVDDDQPTFWDKVEQGRWEPGTIAVLADSVGPHTTFLDLGAWVGPTTLIAAAAGARCIAVEADPSALAQLRRNLAANAALPGRVTVVDRAVSAAPGLVRLGARRKPGDSMSSVLLTGSATTWDSEAITPADLAVLVGSAPDLFIKIDIEGGEFGLAPALAPLLAGPRVSVLLSLHPSILRDGVGADAALGQVTRALAPFTGWGARPVGTEVGEPQTPRPQAILDGRQSDEWLLTKVS